MWRNGSAEPSEPKVKVTITPKAASLVLLLRDYFGKVKTPGTVAGHRYGAMFKAGTPL